MLNQVVLVGRLANDPELKMTPSGVSVCTFRIAVDRQFKNAQNERETDFFTVVAWRATAEFIANYVHKGYLVGLTGRIQARSWEDQSGNRRSTVEVVCDNLQLLSRPREPGDGDHGYSQNAPPPPARGAASAEAPAYDDPFEDQ